MRIAVFEAKCLDCEKIFPSPQLSDFQYGAFIFNCKCGKAFSYHECVSHPATTIFDLLCDIYGSNTNRLQEFSAFFADNISGHILTTDSICPQCVSKNIIISINKKITLWEIPITSYNKLYSFSKEKLFKEFEKFLSKPCEKFCNT